MHPSGLHINQHNGKGPKEYKTREKNKTEKQPAADDRGSCGWQAYSSLTSVNEGRSKSETLVQRQLLKKRRSSQ